MKNALSIDLEFWYSAELIRPYAYESNDLILDMTKPILDLLDTYNTRATFFVLGKVAERYPELIEEIHEKGHEIASHSYSHKTLHDLGRACFEDEVEKSVLLLKKITGENVRGFRAPTFSLNNETKWAFDVLSKFKFEYDSSVFPMKTNLYGVQGAPLCPYWPSRDDISKEDKNGECKVLEIPPTICKIGFMKIPIAGGFYLRALPIPLLDALIRKTNRNSFSVVYLHPWELIPLAPRINLPFLSKFITYYNIDLTLDKLKHLLNNFNYSTIEDAINDI